jgi:beta-N-acetylhexosaminidase
MLLILLLAVVVAGCAGDRGNSGDSGEEEPSEAAARTGGEGQTTRGSEERMSLREAVGQMFVVSMSGTEPNYYIEKMIRERNVGGVLLFASNMKSEAQTQRLVGSLQRLSMDTEPSVLLFVAVDQEGGEISSAPWVDPQPSAAQVGDTGNPQKARTIAEKMGRQLRQAGVNTDLAPVAETGSGAAIGSRSFGSDPELVSRMVAASVGGFEEAGVVSSAKHFPNHGPATVDSHTGRSVIRHDSQTIRSYDLPPLRAAIDAGVPMVMVGHLTYPAIDPEHPASLSPKAIGMLRQELGFEGVVITDDLSMEAAKRDGTTPQAAVQAVKAGTDVMIVSNVPEVQAASYRAVVEAVESGEIPREQIYDSLERTMEVKEEYPLYEGS